MLTGLQLFWYFNYCLHISVNYKYVLASHHSRGIFTELLLILVYLNPCKNGQENFTLNIDVFPCTDSLIYIPAFLAFFIVSLEECEEMYA